MTKLYEDVDATDDDPHRKGFRNFTWTHDAIREWEDIWHQLWHLGYKWEWQNSDRYARKRGDIYNLFACHNDAVRLDMAVPLPGLVVLEEIRESLLDDPGDDQRLDRTVGAIDAWFKEHYTPA